MSRSNFFFRLSKGLIAVCFLAFFSFFSNLQGVAANTSSQSAPLALLDDMNFQEVISKQTIVVDFYTDWCPPCRKLAPLFEALSKEMGSQVLFAKVNIDKAKKTAEHSKIESIPTLIVYKNGKEVKRHVGGCNAETLRRFVQSAL